MLKHFEYTKFSIFKSSILKCKFHFELTSKKNKNKNKKCQDFWTWLWDLNFRRHIHVFQDYTFKIYK